MPPLPHMRRPNSPVMFGRTPNITGALDFDVGSDHSYWFAGGSGALYNDGNSGNVQTMTLDGPDIQRSKDTQIKMRASRSSNVYAGSKVQPKALSVLACIRT